MHLSPMGLKMQILRISLPLTVYNPAAMNIDNIILKRKKPSSTQKGNESSRMYFIMESMIDEKCKEVISSPKNLPDKFDGRTSVILTRHVAKRIQHCGYRFNILVLRKPSSTNMQHSSKCSSSLFFFFAICTTSR